MLQPLFEGDKTAKINRTKRKDEMDKRMILVQNP